MNYTHLKCVIYEPLTIISNLCQPYSQVFHVFFFLILNFRLIVTSIYK